MLIRRNVHVRGLVQGVYYRDTCCQLAREAGVNGWVRNLHNGDVEAVFEGSPDGVQRLVGWAAEGPGAAEVTECAVTTGHPEGDRDFRVLDTAPTAERASLAQRTGAVRTYGSVPAPRPRHGGSADDVPPRGRAGP
ncbi:acylphosphatase [Streptomyces sp. NPDC006990]|uniref:acylphosphatase n=1 Tax=Streptomyces sp. NPDC006990 TaxID=3154481 RepID=UPI003452F918